MEIRRIVYSIIFLFSCFFVEAQEVPQSIRLESPEILLTHMDHEFVLRLSSDTLLPENALRLNGKVQAFEQKGNTLTFKHRFQGKEQMNIHLGEEVIYEEFKPIPLFYSIIPPLLAIVFALIFKEVVIALFLGLLCGTSIIGYYGGMNVFAAIFNGLLRVIDTYVVQSLNDSAHISIIVFSMMIGGMVYIITANGGMNGVVRKLSKKAINPKSGQFFTWLLGISIFFDDYANTLVVGNTMRPITDKLRISREKLSYIVDSTAAPIAATAFVTTWVGAELSYIQDSIETIGLQQSAYQVFISSLPYALYPILSLAFVLIIILKNRDFGSMLTAEAKARQSAPIISDEISDKEKNEGKWYNAVVPVLVIIFGTIAGLFYTGLESVNWNSEMGITKNLSQIIGNADTYKALLWSSLLAVIVAILMSVAQRILSLKKCIESLIDGYKSMVNAIVILILAWSIALLTQHMHTAEFMTSLMLDVNLSPHFLPAVSFVLAAFISFATGSSWGTMAILYPIILPAAWLISKDAGLEAELSMSIFYNTVSTVLSGSVLGDHCSPISDTTVLSSLSSSCNHIDHVRTQMPYALLVGVVSVVFGTIPAAFGISTLWLIPICILILTVFVHFVGKNPEFHKVKKIV